MAWSRRRALVGLDVAGTASVNTEEDSVSSEVVCDDDPPGEVAAYGTARRPLRPSRRGRRGRRPAPSPEGRAGRQPRVPPPQRRALRRRAVPLEGFAHEGGPAPV